MRGPDAVFRIQVASSVRGKGDNLSVEGYVPGGDFFFLGLVLTCLGQLLGIIHTAHAQYA